MTDTTDPTPNDAILAVLREHSVSAPNVDSDTLAGHLADAAANPAKYAPTDDASAGHPAAPEATDASDAAEHADDAPTAEAIAAGKVIEPADGGVVAPADAPAS